MSRYQQNDYDRPTTTFFSPNQPRYNDRGRLGPNAFENPRPGVMPPPDTPPTREYAPPPAMPQLRREYTHRDMYTPATEFSSPEAQRAIRQSTPRAPEPRKPIAKKHRWMIWGGALLVFLIFLILLIVLVIFPSLVKNAVKKGNIDVKSLVVTDPQPSSFMLRPIIMFNDTSMNPTVSATQLDVFQRRNRNGPIIPFAQIELPQIKVDRAVFVPARKMQITNMTEFGLFADTVVHNPFFNVSIQGHAKVSGGSMHTTFDVEKEMVITGFNNLDGYEVRAMAPIIPPDSTGDNMICNITIPNPTPISMALGNVTIDILVNNAIVGHGIINNMIFQPGNNTVTMRARIYQETLLALLPDYPDGMVPIAALARNANFNNQNITWLQSAFLSNTFKTTINASNLLDVYIHESGVQAAQWIAPLLNAPEAKIQNYGDLYKEVQTDAPWITKTFVENIPELTHKLSHEHPALLLAILRSRGVREALAKHPEILVQINKNPEVIAVYGQGQGQGEPAG